MLGALINAPSFNHNGGVLILTRATETCPSASLIEQFAKSMKKYSAMRTLESLGESAKLAASGQNGDVYAYISTLKNELEKIGDGRAESFYVPFDKAINDVIVSLRNSNDELTVTSGFVDLDKMIVGFKPGTLTIIAARPAMGKTAFGLNILVNSVFNQDVPTAFFSLEMTASELVKRIISCKELVNGNAMKTGKLSDGELTRVLDFGAKYSNSKVYIDETPALDIDTFQDRAKQLKKKMNVGLIIIDYLQYMRSMKKTINSREHEIADISRGLKAISKELQIPVISLAQLNRNLDARADKRPVLSDLRESGGIEQDADTIMFLYRDDYYHPNETPNNVAEVIVAKQRSGPTGVVKLHWEGQYTKFDNLDKYF
jgi:replicative DNA helicase